MKDLSVAILAGGKSSRFKNNKLFAQYKGKRLIDISCALAGELTGNLMVIGDISTSDLGNELPVYPDIFPGRGPLGAIHTALQNSGTDFTAILPCDMPLMNMEVYRFIHTQRERLKVVAALSEKGLEPLVSIWPAEALETIKARLEKNFNSPIRAMEAFGVVKLKLAGRLNNYSPYYFTNINTQKDLTRLIKQNPQVIN